MLTGWTTIQLGDAGVWRGGATPSMSVDEYWRNGTIPWVSSGDVKAPVLTNTNQMITAAAVDGSSSPLVAQGSIIIVTRSGILRKFLPVAQLAKPMAINQDIKAITPRPGIYPGFLLHSLIAHGPDILKRCLKSGTTVESVEYGWLKSFELPLPDSYEEQRAIATALSDVDGLLAGLDALIVKKKALKQGAMQQLLTGKQRLPGFKGEWVVRRLGDVAEVAMGHSPLSENYNRTGIGLPLVQGNADIVDRRSISRVWTTQITRACDEGDLIMTVRAPVGAVAIASTRSCIGRGVCALRATSADQKFLYHLLVFSEANWRILEQGSTFTSANSNQVRDFELRVPPTTTEQTAIAEVLSDMDAELAALEARRAKTALLKQGMMQELLTGRVRLVRSPMKPCT